MPTVAIAHSSNRTRSFDATYSLVREALEHIGGLGAFVKPGQRVLLKPDQHCARLSEDGATTDPLLVGVLIRLAWEAGASRVQVGASSASPLSALECMRITGVAAMAKEEGAELLDFSSSEVEDREVFLPEGLEIQDARLPIPLLDNDVIIALPKARTDSRDEIAGSLEFCNGILNKHWQFHQRNQGNLMDRLADVMTVVRADLWITDALICGEGDGPNANAPHWCGCILASTDPVATDSAIAMLLGRDPSKLRFAKALEQRGLGYRSPIVFLGFPPERFGFKAWPSHQGFGHFPVNILTGSGVTEEGTIGHMKQALENLTREGLLQRVIHEAGTPTLLVGNTEDENFEAHISQGPYVVCDDASPAKYREDPRVSFIPGHPVTHSATQDLRRILRGHGLPSSAAPVATRTYSNRGLAAALACAGMGLMLCLQAAGGQRQAP